MKLELSSYGKKYSVEVDQEDLSVNEYLDLFEGLLYQAGFQLTTIGIGFRDKADEMLEKLEDV